MSQAKKSYIYRCFRHSRGFSLVEVVMALGIVSFTVITVVGLLSAGLTTFRDGLNSTIACQIVQRVADTAQQTDYAQLIAQGAVVCYFDEQGNQVTTAAGAVYQVNVVPSASTTLPGSTANSNITTVKIQIAFNPAHVAIANWSNPPTGVSVTTYATVVANGS